MSIKQIKGVFEIGELHYKTRTISIRKILIEIIIELIKLKPEIIKDIKKLLDEKYLIENTNKLLMSKKNVYK